MSTLFARFNEFKSRFVQQRVGQDLNRAVDLPMDKIVSNLFAYEDWFSELQSTRGLALLSLARLHPVVT